MNLGYFHTLLADVKADTEASNVLGLLKTLVDALQGQVNDPNNAAQQTAVGNARDRLLKALNDMRIATYPENARKALREFSLELFLPEELTARIDDAFLGNQITPQVALSELQKLHKRMSLGIGSVNAVLDGFAKLNVESDDLEDGETEILISIPRKFVDEDPSRLGEEFKRLEKILRPFTELATGDYQPIKVRQISSSEFLIAFIILAQVHYAAKVVKAVAEAVGSVIKIYKDVAELRIMKAQLVAMDGNVSKKAIAELDKMAEKLVDSGIEEFAKELVDRYYKKRDAGRKAELLTATKDSLKKIAARIDQGFDFETRAGDLPAPEEVEGGEGEEESEAPETEDRKQLREALEAIAEAHRNQITFVRDGEPILGLPVPENDNDAKEK